MTSITTILIAEDNEPTRKLLSAYVRNAGYEAIEAINGEEALEHLKTQHPDLFLASVILQNF